MATPNASEIACTRSGRDSTFHESTIRCCDWRTEMPISAGSWVSAMVSAAALMNPISTGCETRLSSMPARASPNASWNSPDSSASMIT